MKKSFPKKIKFKLILLKHWQISLLLLLILMIFTLEGEGGVGVVGDVM
jgi:hypothetical protein